MVKRITFYMLAILLIVGCSNEKQTCVSSTGVSDALVIDSLTQSLNAPEGLKLSAFSGPELTPSPACLAVAPSGEVFVGVDMIGSLGKEKDRGHIKRLVDCDHDGVMDSYTEFAKVDNPRGIFPIGDDVFVLHTRFSEETQKAANMDLVVFKDVDKDGVADGPAKVLVKNLSNPTYLQERGTDHATNGIQMGIDGWIYIAIGDFGFYNATGTDGTQLTMLGGGIVRVRPDGTEMEVYTHGLRNIYDMAIDPYMNIYTRGNTNDGGGWNIRFIHQIQTGEYGYPSLFKNYTEEILPALVDVGGGSGTGALFLDDDRWPIAYNKTPMMADWGRNHLYIHRVTENGASFLQDEETFLKLAQITDVDIDGSGIMYLSAWDGAGYSGSPDKGYVARMVPENLEYAEFPDVSSFFWTSSVTNLLQSGSSKTRLAAQYELLQRKKGKAKVLKMAKNGTLPLEQRVAAIFTYAQLAGEEAVEPLLGLAEDPEVQEFALRAMADRKAIAAKMPIDPIIKILEKGTDRVKAAAIVALGRSGKKEGANALLNIAVPSTFIAPDFGVEGPHARPNASVVLPHLAVKALVELNAVEACVAALDNGNHTLALWALRYMHHPKVVAKLIKKYQATTDSAEQKELQQVLARLHYKEAPYDASWWWGTRPDTHGPYYKTVAWPQTETIAAFLKGEFGKAAEQDKGFYALLNTKYRLKIAEFGELAAVEAPVIEAPIANLEEIKNEKGQVGKASIEEVMIAIKQIKGDSEEGALLFKSQACYTCHSLKASEVMKGPFMGQIGSIMNREQIAESILRPNASISQGFSTVELKTNDGKVYVGFITQESANDVTVTNIAGIPTKLQKSEVSQRKELENSMMPAGLANALSYAEMASLIAFLEEQK